MSIILDHQLREKIAHDASAFPISYFQDELAGHAPDPMPNIVFFGSLIAPETSTIHTQYIQPIIDDHALPYAVFRHDRSEQVPVNALIRDIYRLLREQPRCYEMAVQRHLSSIFEYLMLHFNDLPRTEATRVQLNTQVRVHNAGFHQRPLCRKGHPGRHSRGGQHQPE